MNVVDKRVSCQKDSLLTEEEKVGEGRKMELGGAAVLRGCRRAVGVSGQG